MNETKLTIDAYRRGNDCYIKLTGSLTLAASEGLFDKVNGIVSQNDVKLVVGMERLDFVDSAGLGTLIRINGQMKREKRELIFIEPNAQVFKLMTLAKIDLLIPVETGLAGQRLRQELEQPEYHVQKNANSEAGDEKTAEAA